MSDLRLVPVELNYDEIKTRMRKRRMTQEDLALATGVDRSTISRWLNGHRDIPVTKLLLIAAILRCSLPEIIRYNEQ